MAKTPIFLSWSGDRSRAVATALKDWIPLVLEGAAPWHSDTIDAGRRWNADIATKLKECSLGIICVTPENREKPWLLFESGALSKSLDDARVMTYLLEMTPSDIAPPLADFQTKVANREGTLDVLRSVNNVLAEPREAKHLEMAFDAFWPKLEEQLKAIPKPEGKAPPKRPDAEVLGEILSTVRAIRAGMPPLDRKSWARAHHLTDRVVSVLAPDGTTLVLPIEAQTESQLETRIESLRREKQAMEVMPGTATGARARYRDIEMEIHDCQADLSRLREGQRVDPDPPSTRYQR